MLRAAVAALLLAACGSGAEPPLPVSEDPGIPRVRTSERLLPPNVLIIYADDLGYGDVGAYNPQSGIPTPAWNRLAAEGLRFTDAHSSSGICTPSRYALLLGRYHWRAGIHSVLTSWDPPLIEEGHTTLAEVLTSAGYHTGAVGKWHVGMTWGDRFDRDWSERIPDGPIDSGFDWFFGMDQPWGAPSTWIIDDIAEEPTEPFDPQPPDVPEGNDPRVIFAGPHAPGWRSDGVMPRMTDALVDYLRSDPPEPWFIYWAMPWPHTPILVSDEWRGVSTAGAYGDYVAEGDAHIGRVLDALDETGQAAETLVIATSDNGPEHRSQMAYERTRATGHRSMGPLRGAKRDLYEGGHRVPFVMRWPSVLDAGSVSDALVSQVDVFATVAGVAGADVPDGAAEDSLDMFRQARGEIVHNTAEDAYALRSGRWLYIDAPNGYTIHPPDWYESSHYVGDRQPVELFDLGTDLGQHRNRAGSETDRVESMRDRLRELTSL